ncbi:MAG: energy-coupling factor transporter transmembrane protein EcfT [Clostridia bacterium]|nr:energy-coupling factor transporter transmembrane protein EcfT [Clostridia bacterium]
MRDISFGQYYPVSSPVHRLDPRNKLILVILYIVALFFIRTFTGFGIMALTLLVMILFSRVPIGKVLKSVRAVIFLVLFTMVLTFLFYKGEASDLIAEWWIFHLYWQGLISAAKLSLRLILLVMGPALLTLTTTPVELTDGLESLLKPLALIKLPIHELAIIMSIALRLIPTLIEETDKIINAQKARGADFESGNLFKRAKALIPVLIPLFVSSFRRADELADAMDSRCYRGAKGRTRMKVLRFRLSDLVAFLFMAAVFFVILLLRYDWFGWVAMLPFAIL